MTLLPAAHVCVSARKAVCPKAGCKGAFRGVLAVLAVLTALGAHTAACRQPSEKVFSQVFSDYPNSALVVESLNTGRQFVYNPDRAAGHFTAASTFKVYHTLIALKEGALTGQNDLFKYDGHDWPFKSWNKDQSLESAFRVSCVWCYRQLAEKIGPAVYPSYISQAGYGRLKTPFKLTDFWLDGSLKVSAFEQAAFMRAVVEQKLPFDQNHYRLLKSIMLSEKNDRCRLFSKTGWATDTTPNTGWFTGYIETDKDTYLFALNMDITHKDQLPLRARLTMQALHDLGITGR